MMLDIRHKIGIIGLGNMGSVIASRLAEESGEYKVLAFDKDKNKTGISSLEIAKDLSSLVAAVDIILLAVKPQDIDHLLKELKNCSGSKLIISIAAGISTKYLEKVLGNARVIRAMPNIAVKIQESVTCLCKGGFATESDLDFARELFSYLGTARNIDEGLMNAATAISGSGPGYIFYFIENSNMDSIDIPEHSRHDMMRRLEKAAEALGFPVEDASFLAANTVNASLSLLKESGLKPEELRAQVTSKGGTTERGLEVLRKGGSWEEAALAATKRAEELSKRS
ncbi:MAG: pyrroline-5-carboxylate reductase [Candidatus Omnitrophica bacterium]|nr:pyrroline-5-carboxylate reductase [Candidatus Omnitrophota bacterium]MDD4982155.1 pyrroline-5-carboxylate reductase [Candidatus Omnitrophota bacterium]